MGSGGKKKRSRKGGPVKHLPKVGSEEDIRRSQREERHMVMRDIGVPVDRMEGSGAGRVAVLVVGGVLVIAALAGLALLIFR